MKLRYQLPRLRHKIVYRKDLQLQIALFISITINSNNYG